MSATQGADVLLRLVALGDFGFDEDSWMGRQLLGLAPDAHEASAPPEEPAKHQRSPLSRLAVRDAAAIMLKRGPPARETQALALGDNFYPSGLLGGKEGHQQVRRLIETYGPLGLPMWAVLGNHDHMSDINRQIKLTKAEVNPVVAQRAPAAATARARVPEPLRMWNMPARFYDRVFADGLVHAVFLDSESRDLDWQIGKMRSVLEASTARWRVVVAHHPLRSDYRRYDGKCHEALRGFVMNWAHLYVTGHDHSVQVLPLKEDYTPGPLQVVSGGAGNPWGCSRFKYVNSIVRTRRLASGFALLDFSHEAITVRPIEVQYGYFRELDSVILRHDGQISRRSAAGPAAPGQPDILVEAAPPPQPAPRPNSEAHAMV